MPSRLLDFNVTYVRNIADNQTLWIADMDYLRSRIGTHRSMNNERLTIADNRLYEGAKTLIDMIDYMRLVKTRFMLNEIHLEIDNENDFPRALLTATIRVFDSEDEPHGPVTVTMIYTPVGQKTIHGAYITSVKATRGDMLPYRSGVGNIVIRDYFGNIPVLEKYVNVDEPYCYKAGQSLRYSENLPTPSEFVNELDMCISDAMVYLTLDERS